MAYSSGTASDYKDLLAITVTFATANGWTALEQTETKAYLKGSGLAGLDEIYVGVETYENPTSSIYNWNLYGSVGYVVGRAIADHPGGSYRFTGGRIVTATLWNTSIPYWMVANGRRIIVVAKVGTVYISLYLGLLTPPATDAQYPYPLFLGGCLLGNGSGYTSTSMYSFWTTRSNNNVRGRLLRPGGIWGDLCTYYQSTTANNPFVMPGTACMDLNLVILDGIDGTYLLEPIYIGDTLTPYGDIFGHMEGLFKISGYNNTSENIVTVDGVNYLVFQDIARNDIGDFCAMRMN